MKHRFSEVATVDKPRSTFDRSHGLKTTFDFDYLVPVLVDEIYPGDTVNLSMSGFARLSTPTYPIMDNHYLDTFFFFVPCRQLWENWQRFMGERDPDPDDSIDYTIPQNVVNNAANQSLADYFGIPTQVAANNSVNALPFRAYWHIWDEWFRDENLQDGEFKGGAGTGDGPDTKNVENTTSVLKRGKRHDYFTSCLPWLQRGDAVQLSLGTTAPIYGASMDFDDVADSSNYAQVRDAAGSSANLKRIKLDGSNFAYGASTTSGSGELTVDLSQATAGTVNELRLAIQTQALLELDARAGTRYIEIIESHFGARSEDHRLQRPEYLGGGSAPININPVAETAASSAGTLGAFATAGFKGHGFVKSFVEHGYLIGLVNARADLTYQEGLERFWSRSTRLDWYWPLLAHLGEMSVLNKEIYVDATDLGDGTSEEVWGYQERFADLRYKPSKITGKFRSNDAATLDAWHSAIEFGDTPTLGDSFIQAAAPIDRNIVTASEPHLIMDCYFKMHHTRCMPVYSIPGMITRF